MVIFVLYVFLAKKYISLFGTDERYHLSNVSDSGALSLSLVKKRIVHAIM